MAQTKSLPAARLLRERLDDRRRPHTGLGGGSGSSAVLYLQEETAAFLARPVALNIKDDTADRLARELAAATGESNTTAAATAARERLERLRGSTHPALAEADDVLISAGTLPETSS